MKKEKEIVEGYTKIYSCRTKTRNGVEGRIYKDMKVKKCMQKRKVIE